MAKMRSSDGSNSRLQMNYREYMERYKQQKKQNPQSPVVEDDAQLIHEPSEKIPTPPAEPERSTQVAEVEKAPETQPVKSPATFQEERRAQEAAREYHEDYESSRDVQYDPDDPDAPDIQNPFMDMLHRAKHYTKKASEFIGSKRESQSLSFEEDGEDEDEEQDDILEDDGAELSGWSRFLMLIGFKPLGDEDLDEDERVRKQKKRISQTGLEPFHQSFERNTDEVRFVEEIDPVFKMDGEDKEKPQGRPERDSREHAPRAMEKRLDRTYRTHDNINTIEQEKLNVEGVDIMTSDQNNSKKYDEMLGYESGEPVAMSRRERKAREAAASSTTTKKYPQAKPAPKAPVLEDLRAVDEPTQEFRPIRARTDGRVPEPYYDEYEDAEEPQRPAPQRLSKRKPRVYSDYEDDYEQDDDDDGYDDDYDDEYDDYDFDDEDDEGDERNSLGHHILGFLKALFAIILILIVVVIGLRLLESAKIISLDAVRSSVGKYLPIEMILPAPAEEGAPSSEEPTVPPDEQAIENEMFDQSEVDDSVVEGDVDAANGPEIGVGDDGFIPDDDSIVEDADSVG